MSFNSETRALNHSPFVILTFYRSFARITFISHLPVDLQYSLSNLVAVAIIVVSNVKIHAIICLFASHVSLIHSCDHSFLVIYIIILSTLFRAILTTYVAVRTHFMPLKCSFIIISSAICIVKITDFVTPIFVHLPIAISMPIAMFIIVIYHISIVRCLALLPNLVQTFIRSVALNQYLAIIFLIQFILYIISSDYRSV